MGNFLGASVYAKLYSIHDLMHAVSEIHVAMLRATVPEKNVNKRQTDASVSVLRCRDTSLFVGTSAVTFYLRCRDIGTD